MVMRSSERHALLLRTWLIAGLIAVGGVNVVYSFDESNRDVPEVVAQKPDANAPDAEKNAVADGAAPDAAAPKGKAARPVPPKAVIKEIPLPPPDRPAPGSIRVDSGMIFSGMYSKATTLAPIRRDGGPLDRPDQQLEMRLIDQKAREIYVSGRRAEPPVANNLVWPNSVFVIPQKRISRKVMPEGIPTLGQFDSEGLSRGTLHRSNGRKDEIVVGIVAINELYAEVSCLTHDWSYCISFDSIPRQHLPAILSHVQNFRDRNVRLDLVKMLIKSNRLPEARELFNTLLVNFPELANADEQQQIREEIARQITKELEQRRDFGQHKLAANGARVLTRDNLTPETVVRVERLEKDYGAIEQRIEAVRMSIPVLVAGIEDDALRESVTLISRTVLGEIDPDTIDRFAAYEIVASTPGDIPNDEILGMALSGWLLGAENTVRNLNDIVSLFEARELILDYMNTSPEEAAVRQALAERISALEGLGVERVAAMVKHLPAFAELPIEFSDVSQGGDFTLDATDSALGAVGRVPPEYHESRQYPLLIALHGPFDDASRHLSYLRGIAESNGYILVAPEWSKRAGTESDVAPSGYYTSAEFHRLFAGLMLRLKQHLRIDDDRVFVSGHSFGGDIAMDLAASQPDLFAGVVTICGTGYRHLQWTAPNAIQMPWYVVIGDAQAGWFDRMGPLSARLFKRDTEMKVVFDTTFIKYPSRGLEIYHEEFESIFDWMSRYRRNRSPEKIYANLLRSTDLHWSWVKLQGLPPQFAQLDAESAAPNGTYRPAELNIQSDDSNLIRIRSAPSDLSIMLSPDMKNLNLEKPIRIHNGRKLTTVDYDPEVTHLLEELYATGDRARLCHMRVEIAK
jgi:pimeloyl-ACP methyl ester carboxylesterase